MKLKDLLGFRLVSIDESVIVVKNREDKTFVLEIIDYKGDCCGFNDIEANLCISDGDTESNPIITNIDVETCEYEGGGSKGHVTFYGGNKKLASVDACSSSGSGWEYGACVRVYCKELEIDETLSSW